MQALDRNAVRLASKQRGGGKKKASTGEHAGTQKRNRIAEFLKNEFHHRDYDEVRGRLSRLVLRPNLQDDAENMRRKKLFFRKRGGMWRELPRDTAWWEVEIVDRALDRIRIFPRADWRRYARGRFSLPQITSRLRIELERSAAKGSGRDPFLERLKAFSLELAMSQSGGMVLLIGIDEQLPLTIIEGNHRMAAAALASAPLRQFRFLCGFSPRMKECCWYEARFSNLLHYAGNVLRDISVIRHSDIAQAFANRKTGANPAPAPAASDANLRKSPGAR